MRRAIIDLMVSFCFVILFSSCSSPESDGTSMANKINECKTAYLENLQKVGTQFVGDFDRLGFQTRAAAKQGYQDVMAQTNAQFEKALAELYEDEVETGEKYAKNYKMKAKYDEAFYSGLDQSLDEQLGATVSMSAEIPEFVMAKVRTIIPYKPSSQQIQNDLVGRSLLEGVEDGYYDRSWRWVIKEGEISDFSIENVSEDTQQAYRIIANMRLTSEVGKAFDAKVEIRYILPQNDDWTMEYVQSKGLQIVKTNQYVGCIKDYMNTSDTRIFNTEFRADNTCDKALEIGGKILNHDGWYKFSEVIGPHGFYRCYAIDYKLDYVEIP